MAWTAPRTYTDGEVITAAILNVDWRDNLLALSTHQHSGAAGDGDDELEGVDWITFDHIADPAAPGAGKLRLYAKSGGPYIRDGAAGAVTALSLAGHAHTFVEDETFAGSPQGFNGGSTNDGISNDGATSYTVSTTFNPTEAAMVTGGGVGLSDSSVADGEVKIDGVSVITQTNAKWIDIIGTRQVASGSRVVSFIQNGVSTGSWCHAIVLGTTITV